MRRNQAPRRALQRRARRARPRDWFATRDLRSAHPRPDDAHVLGPFPDETLARALGALADLLGRGTTRASDEARVLALGLGPRAGPSAECFREGLARLVAEHGLEPGCDVRRLRGLGASLWARRIEERAREDGPVGSSEPDLEAPAAREWGPERVAARLEEGVERASHALRRARWLLRLSEATVAWTEPGEPDDRRRALVLERGEVAARLERLELPPGGEAPAPPGRLRPRAERRALQGAVVFDRLRVLTTEIRRVVSEGGGVEVRFGRRASAAGHRLERVLRWI